MKRGCIDLSPSVQASLASRQYISIVSEAADGNGHMHIVNRYTSCMHCQEYYTVYTNINNKALPSANVVTNHILS